MANLGVSPCSTSSSCRRPIAAIACTPHGCVGTCPSATGRHASGLATSASGRTPSSGLAGVSIAASYRHGSASGVPPASWSCPRRCPTAAVIALASTPAGRTPVCLAGHDVASRRPSSSRATACAICVGSTSGRLPCTSTGHARPSPTSISTTVASVTMAVAIAGAAARCIGAATGPTPVVVGRRTCTRSASVGVVDPNASGRRSATAGRPIGSSASASLRPSGAGRAVRRRRPTSMVSGCVDPSVCRRRSATARTTCRLT